MWTAAYATAQQLLSVLDVRSRCRPGGLKLHRRLSSQCCDPRLFTCTPLEKKLLDQHYKHAAEQQRRRAATKRPDASDESMNSDQTAADEVEEEMRRILEYHQHALKLKQRRDNMDTNGMTGESALLNLSSFDSFDAPDIPDACHGVGVMRDLAPFIEFVNLEA